MSRSSKSDEPACERAVQNACQRQSLVTQGTGSCLVWGVQSCIQLVDVSTTGAAASFGATASGTFGASTLAALAMVHAPVCADVYLPGSKKADVAIRLR